MTAPALDRPLCLRRPSLRPWCVRAHLARPILTTVLGRVPVRVTLPDGLAEVACERDQATADGCGDNLDALGIALDERGQLDRAGDPAHGRAGDLNAGVGDLPRRERHRILIRLLLGPLALLHALHTGHVVGLLLGPAARSERQRKQGGQ